jgi:hypothetical protein
MDREPIGTGRLPPLGGAKPPFPQLEIDGSIVVRAVVARAFQQGN